MKKKFFIAVILFFGFVSALSFFSNEDVQTVTEETTVKPKPSKNLEGITLFKGENDFWEAEFSVSEESTNQLKLKHKQDGNELPNELSFTLSTAYNPKNKSIKIGEYTLSFNTFPESFALNFAGENIIQPPKKKLLLKITGEGHYQFFNLYIEE
jgi:hypothetical protein